MRVGELAAIAAAMARAGLARLKLEGPGLYLVLERGPQSVSAEAAAAGAVPSDLGRPQPVRLGSPGPGTLLWAHPLHEAPLAAEGEAVAAGRPVALVRVGDLLLPVRAPVAGVVVRALAEEGALVGWGDALFELRPEA